jgi:hypothetical protein
MKDYPLGSTISFVAIFPPEKRALILPNRIDGYHTSLVMSRHIFVTISATGKNPGAKKNQGLTSKTWLRALYALNVFTKL